MLSKGIKLTIKGYTLVESLVAVVIISISLALSTQLLSSPLLGSSHLTLVDIEQITDSLKNSSNFDVEKYVIHRFWGICIVRSTPIQSFENLLLIEINGITNAGLSLPTIIEVYEVNK